MTRLIELEGLKFLQNEFKASSDNLLFFKEFVKLPLRGVAVELGAGFGLGTVYLAKRYPQTEIVAVEYQKPLYDLLLKNLELNGVKNVNPLLCDVRKIERCLKPQIADAVYSNPPFWRKKFLKDANKSEVYIKANYEVEADYKDFLKSAKYLLKSSKSLFFMFETPRMVEVICKLKSLKFTPKRLRLVFPKKGKSSHVFYIESVLGGKEGHLKVEEPLYSTPLGS